MYRLIPLFAVFALGLGLLSADAQDAKKKQIDATNFSGKITDVNLDEKGEKLESLYVKGLLGKKIQQRNVRINEKTQFEYSGFKNKADEKPHVGDTAEGKIDANTDYATKVKITAGAGLKAPPKKKTTK